VYERDEEVFVGIGGFHGSDEKEFPEQAAHSWTEGIGLANVTPDGRYLVFMS
jgi:hypothetical protein